MGGKGYGGNYMEIIKVLRKNEYINLYISYLSYLYHYYFPYKIYGQKWEKKVIESRFYKTFNKKIDWDNPQTLNEKLQWLKLYYHKDFHTTCADKYAARNIWKKYGKEGLIPILYQTYSYRDITMNVIPDCPCIVKCNTGSAAFEIIRDKSKLDIKKLKYKCRTWLMENYYYCSQEWQYKNIRPCIIIEKLLLDQNGHIPNDYKLNYINGKLEFIYCSVDREGENYRSIYSPMWERMNVEWVSKKDHKGGLYGENIAPPKTLDRMIQIGNDIAKNFAYVRVDFYDVDGQLYYGEITLHHGSGYDTFEPKEYDEIFGKKLKLPKIEL